MTNRKWKVGLLGAGYISEVHVKALRQRRGIELAAVCDLSLARAEQAARKHGIARAFASLEQFLAAEMNVVHVLLPAEGHVEAARRVLESGRHAFVEKPMGLNSRACRELAELADRKQLRLGVDHNFLFLRSFEKLRRHAADGTLGRLDRVAIHWQYPLGLIQSGPFGHWILREPQNLFFELGPHLLAFSVDLVGPLDALRTSVSSPIDLPGGGRVYRHWHVHGSKGHTEVDLILSVVPGPAVRSVAVRGLGAVATCDFGRDLYHLEEAAGSGPFEDFRAVASSAWQIGLGAGGNLLRSVSGTLRKAPSADAFSDSVSRSIDRFYGVLEGAADARFEPAFGASVVAECERVIAGATLEPRREGDGVWAVSTPKRPPTVLVLGGTGFIGRSLVRALSSKDVGIRVATRALRSAQVALAGLPVEIVQGDLADPGFMDRALENIEVVYHLAKADGTRWEDYYRNDVLVTKNIAERALAKGVQRFIYTGTIASYDTASASSVITSDTPLDPRIEQRNHYARSKAACEAILMKLHRERGFPVVIFRPGIVIGKGSPPAHWGVGMFVSDTRVRLWGDGMHPLPFVLVEDVADALVLALDAEGIEGHCFLLTDEPLLSAQEYVAAISATCGTRLRVRPTPIWRFYAEDLLKEAVKHLIRHPNRRMPSYRDWNSRGNRARFDSAKTRERLNWRPAGTREALVARGIAEPVRDLMR